MPLPKPERGLVVRYGFIWARDDRPAHADAAAKSRPCLIVDVEEVEEPGLPGRPVTRVTYVPFSSALPRAGDLALPVPPAVMKHLGLRAESYLYLSYAVEDDWPYDLEALPGAEGRFHYGFIPPRLYNKVRDAFRAQAGYPSFVTRRKG
ncbi:MAG: hypothetical protein JNK21_12980 [Rhodospirillaceae bacterium]|nr:hypothetical protein [Rhodospirillaceae bacterium]